MNIFAIESKSDRSIDWHKSALSHDNFRVNKMIIESCQMLSTNAQLFGYTTRYRKCFANHPSTMWARESSSNFKNLVQLAVSLRDEFMRRHNRTKHGCDDVISQMISLSNNQDFLDKFFHNTPTTLPLCMPDEYKCDDVVESYRRYFANKPNLRYYSEDVPAWVDEYREDFHPPVKIAVA